MNVYLPRRGIYKHEQERELIKSIVAALTLRRIADSDIIKVIFDQTGKTITIRQQIKRESYHWYNPQPLPPSSKHEHANRMRINYWSQLLERKSNYSK